MKPLSVICVACLALLAGAGCKSDPLQKVQVHGKVTFNGKECPGVGRITFTPLKVAAGLPRRPASGEFQTNGEYVASSFRPGDGVVPGTYRVSIACYNPEMLSGSPGDDEFRKASFVADSFEPPELVIEPGSSAIEYDLDVPLK